MNNSWNSALHRKKVNNSILLYLHKYGEQRNTIICPDTSDRLIRQFSQSTHRAEERASYLLGDTGGEK